MYRKILEIQAARRTAVLVTIISAKGSTPREIGAKMLVTETEFFGSIGGGGLEWIALERARELLKEASGAKLSVPLCSKAQQCCGGYVEIFFEMIQPKPQLLIFGGGHVGQALLETMAGTAFECLLVDERPEWIEIAEQKKSQWPHLDLQTHLSEPLRWIEEYRLWNGSSTYAAIMTHDHGLDEAIVAKLTSKPLKYLGLIGSKTKKERFSRRLENKGVSAEAFAQVICPMGIAIGGKAPKEVALSIAAQLVQIHHSSLEKNLPE